MIYLKLFFEFFKLGVFVVGGGMAAVPFLQEMSVRTGWFPERLISDMIAISESTPGPIGINMATYVGFTVGGVPGGIIATLGEICPAIIIVSLVAKYFALVRDSKIVGDIFSGLRPAVTGLIAAACYGVMKISFVFISAAIESGNILDVTDPLKLALFAVMFFAVRKFKKSPILYIAISAVLGIVLKL
ncbi:MAG: chromate transporter [Oscillospiraceae bacterium]|nr:chromate transporter [Oscillospiraceae bacterium]